MKLVILKVIHKNSGSKSWRRGGRQNLKQNYTVALHLVHAVPVKFANKIMQITLGKSNAYFSMGQKHPQDPCPSGPGTVAQWLASYAPSLWTWVQSPVPLC